jgi:hypothetical protein
MMKKGKTGVNLQEEALKKSIKHCNETEIFGSQTFFTFFYKNTNLRKRSKGTARTGY